MAFNPLNRKLDKNGNPIVTKEELDKSGMSLRDFLNRERGLERKGDREQAAAKAASIREADDERAAASARRAAAKQVEGKDDTVNPSVRRGTNPENKTELSDLTFKKGGKVSSASRRADGIATKGKTRGKIC